MIMQLSNVTVPSLLTSKTLCLSQDADPSFLLQYADKSLRRHKHSVSTGLVAPVFVL